MSNFKNNIIAYTVDRSSVSGLYILVANGQVVVRAPWYLSTQKIQQYVEEKTKWIVEKLREHEDKDVYKRQVVWNGPLGVCEFPKFKVGTEEIAKVLAELDAVKMCIRDRQPSYQQKKMELML